MIFKDYKESKKSTDKNVKEISCEKTFENMEENYEKKMKIKVNFKPYIPKHNHIKRKQGTGSKLNKHQSSATKNDTKVFIKVKDISLLTNPEKTSNDFDRDTNYLEYEGPSAGIQEDLTREIANSPISNEPLDLSLKQAQTGDVLPLDLTKTKDSPFLPQANTLPITDGHNTSNDNHVDQISSVCTSSTTISLPSIQIITAQAAPGPVLTMTPSTSFIISDNPCHGEITRIRIPDRIVSLENITQESPVSHGLLNYSTNDTQQPFTRSQLQKPKFKKLPPSKSTKMLMPMDISKKKQNTKQEGMVKVNEKITSNGGVFCTFRNFTRSRAKNKAMTK